MACFPNRVPGRPGHFDEMTYSMSQLMQGDGSGSLGPLVMTYLSLCQLFFISKRQCILKIMQTEVFGKGFGNLIVIIIIIILFLLFDHKY